MSNSIKELNLKCDTLAKNYAMLSNNYETLQQQNSKIIRQQMQIQNKHDNELHILLKSIIATNERDNSQAIRAGQPQVNSI